MATLDDYVTTTEAAKIIGVSHTTVTRYCTKGDLAHERKGPRLILIKLRDAKKFKRPKRGNPNHIS